MLIEIVSPYSGDVERNKAYLRQCMALVLKEGHTPVAGHAYLPDVLDDNDPEQRQRGIQAGHEMLSACKEVQVFVDFGISNGMWEDIRFALQAGIPVSMRLRNAIAGSRTSKWSKGVDGSFFIGYPYSTQVFGMVYPLADSWVAVVNGRHVQRDPLPSRDLAMREVEKALGLSAPCEVVE